MLPPEHVITSQVTLGLFFSGVLQWLKNAKWLPFVNQHSAAINHGIMLLTSAVGATGVHYAYNAAAHSLTFTNLSFALVVSHLWLWAQQWTAQFLVHRGIFGVIAAPAAAPGTKS